LTEDQIEAIVSEAIAAEASSAQREAAPPSSAIVWWRAQMRARQDAARAAERPLTVVHAVAIACGVGLILSVVGTAIAGVRGSTAWLAAVYDSGRAALPRIAEVSTNPASPWFTLTLTAGLFSILVASVAAYIILADE
jgi:hypothetical protein